MHGKIIQVEIAGKGGICHYAYNLVSALTSLKEVILVTGSNYELSNLKPGFKVIEVFNRFRTNPFVFFKLYKLFNEKEVEVIHFQLSQHPAFVYLLCLLVKKFTHKNIVITSHNVISHEDNWFENIVYKNIYSIADKIIVHADSNKSEMVNNLNINCGKIEVIPHGNYGFFNEATDYVAPDNAFNVLFFGFIRQYKGLFVLLEALKIAKADIPQIKLFIVGKAQEDFQKYKEKIESLDLTGNVEENLEYIPFEKVKEYFLKANLVVLPYLKIYQSGILQLAYGFGRPVVVTNVGGLPEAVDEGNSGFIVSAGDSGSLAKRIVQVLKDRELQCRMGKYALILSKTKFSWEQIALKTLELY
jgi:glycosyltransferase involved in cell wall biosynthesis